MNDQTLREVLVTVVRDTFSAMLDLSIAEHSEHAPALDEQPHPSAVVHIVGDWMGSVVLHASRTLAMKVAARMFGDTGDAGASDCDDAMRELINIIGGNIKSALGSRCVLSSPKSFGLGDHDAPTIEGELLGQAVFESDGDLFRVEVYNYVMELPVIEPQP